MHCCLRVGQTVFLLLALQCSAVLAQAAPPYLVLRQPAASPELAEQAVPESAAAPLANPQIPVARQGYSYGWFGAAPRRHPSRHFGYRKHYIQWVWQ